MRSWAGIACATLFTAAASAASGVATDYPKKPVRIVVGIAPAGGLDVMTRLAAQKLTERLGQTFVTDNRPGGGTVVAMDIVAYAPADGYTLLSASETLMLNGVLKRSPYDVRAAFVPIVQLTSQPYALIVNPAVPVKSFKELIAYAKSRPGTLNYGSQGTGTTGHIGMERFKQMAGVDFVHVPYKGAAPALMDLIGGQIQVAFSSLATGGPYFRSGRVRTLAVTSPRRSPAYPDLPTVAEAGLPGYELHNTYSYYAPAKTPPAIVRAINTIVSQAMNAPEIAKPLTAEGTLVLPPATPEEFKAKFDRDYAELERTIKSMPVTLN